MRLRIHHISGLHGQLSTDPEAQPMSGMANAVVHIAAAQASRGHQVAVLAYSGSFRPGSAAWRGIQIISMARWRRARVSSFDASLLLPMLWQTVRQPKADVLHVHAEFGLLYLPKSSIRVLHLHMLPVLAPATYQRLLRRTEAVVCCSEYLCGRFLSATGYARSRTFVVYNGAEPCRVTEGAVSRTRQQLGVGAGDVLLLFLGALVPDKGLHVLLDALHILNASSASATARLKTVVVGGRGLWGEPGEVDPYEQRLTEVSQGLDIAFLGLVAHKEIPRFLAACDFVVCPSTCPDSLPSVVLEAMAAGKPVVATEVGGIPEMVVNGETGLLVPPGDAAVLARAIDGLANDGDGRARMSRAAQARSRLFTWEATAEKLETIYHTFLAQKGAR